MRKEYKQWQHGEIIRIYKGKWIKGKCNSERGIALASNTGKLFEIIINNRIKKVITITETQPGGQASQSTTDHIMILNSMINQAKRKGKKQGIHIAFLDVTKAYDKAWLNAIIYTAHKSGITRKHRRLIKERNSNLQATIRTKHGPSRTITIKDSIRQGGVLYVIGYANLIDELAKELIKKTNWKPDYGATQSQDASCGWMM